MGKMTKSFVLGFFVLTVFAGNVWAGWFSFEPNILLLDGAYVARELEDLQKETEYRKKGDTIHADELIKDSRILIIDSQKYDNRVEFVKFTEQGNNIFVLVKDESGTKMWSNMLTLACQGTDGSSRPVNKDDLTKGNLQPLTK